MRRIAKSSAIIVTGIAVFATLIGTAINPGTAQSPSPTPAKPGSPGQTLYIANCSMCHQPDRRGSAPENPSLIGVSERFSDKELTETIQQGLPRMPAFPDLKPDQVTALIAYLKTPETPAAK